MCDGEAIKIEPTNYFSYQYIYLRKSFKFYLKGKEILMNHLPLYTDQIKKDL